MIAERKRESRSALHGARTVPVIAVAIAAAAALSGDAHANIGSYGRHDYVARFSPPPPGSTLTSGAIVEIDGGGGGRAIIGVRDGRMSITSLDGRCTPDPDAPRPCGYAINSIDFRLDDFEISGVKVEGLEISSWQPIAYQGDLIGIMSLPEGTLFNAGARVDGSASAFPVRTGVGAFFWNPEIDKLELLGTFKGNVDGRDLDITVLTSADMPFANHPPRANAGPDQHVETECAADVVLDASGTKDADGNFSHAFFTEYGLGVGPHAKPIPFLPGRHLLTLEARDKLGARDTDDVVIDVRDTGTTPAVPGATRFEIALPPGVRPEDVAVGGRRSLALGPQSTVLPGHGAGTIVNLGSTRATLGTQSHVRDVWSRGPLVANDRAVIDGSVHTDAPIDLKNGATVSGSVDESAVFDPMQSTAWNIVEGSAELGDVYVPSDESRRLAPGRYGHVFVDTKGTLELDRGVYTMRDLFIEPNARVDAGTTGGALLLHVLSTLDYKGDIVGPAASELLVIDSGPGPVFLNAPFNGTLLAPDARVVLAQAGDRRHTGALLAGDVDVRPGVVVEHEPFRWSIFRENRSACVITPTLTCVAQTSTGWVARFGYANVLTYSGITVPLGLFNRFSPGPELRGQPSAFQPGMHDAVFEVPFDGSALTWIVGSRSVTATKEGKRCP